MFLYLIQTDRNISKQLKLFKLKNEQIKVFLFSDPSEKKNWQKEYKKADLDIT